MTTELKGLLGDPVFNQEVVNAAKWTVLMTYTSPQFSPCTTEWDGDVAPWLTHPFNSVVMDGRRISSDNSMPQKLGFSYDIFLHSKSKILDIFIRCFYWFE